MITLAPASLGVLAGPSADPSADPSARVLLLDVLGVARGLPRDEASALAVLADLRAMLAAVGGSIVATSRLPSPQDRSNDRCFPCSARVSAALASILDSFPWQEDRGIARESGWLEGSRWIDQVDEARRRGSREVGAVLRRWVIGHARIGSLAIADRSADLGSMSPHAIWIGGGAGQVGAREVQLASMLLSLSVEEVRCLDDRVLDRIEEEVMEPRAALGSESGLGSGSGSEA